MADQLRDIVSAMVAAGESEENIGLVIQRLSHDAPTEPAEPPAARPIATGGGRGTGLDVRKSNQWASDNAPAIGATLATAATGGLAAPLSLPLMMATAGAGGAGGAALRGDDAEGIATQGVIQGALQGAPAALSKAAGITYRVAIPKLVQDKFAKAPLVIEGLRNRVLLGTRRGTQAAENAGNVAAGKISSATASVPEMSAQDVQAAFGPKYNKALVANKTARANEINAHVKTSMEEIGSRPMNGQAQLARKEFLEPESRAAMAATNPNMAAVNPQLANIERKAIVKNLRSSPDMTQALNESQAAIGLSKAANATENSSIFTRGISPLNMARSPLGFSGAGIGLNELSKVDPQLIRLLDLIMGAGSHEQ